MMVIITSIDLLQEIFWLMPGLYIRRKDRKHRLENMFLSCPAMAWS